MVTERPIRGRAERPHSLAGLTPWPQGGMAATRNASVELK